MTTSPAEAAYNEWRKYFHSNCPFHKLSKREQSFWTSVADAVIEQSKTIIAEEMAKALTKLSPISSDDQVRVKRHLKAFKVTQQ